MGNKEYWEKVYDTKAPDAVSWYAPHLEISLNLIHQATSNKGSAIIDIGGHFFGGGFCPAEKPGVVYCLSECGFHLF